MTEKEEQLSMNDVLFVALVRDFESMAMVGFGKLVDPVTQKAERNLDRAKVAIDMLGMLDEKTRGNLNQVQTALMRQVLTNLRLNYVDEADKAKAEAEEKPEGVEEPQKKSEEKKPDEKERPEGEPETKAEAAAGETPEAKEEREEKAEPAAGKNAKEKTEDKSGHAASGEAEEKPKEPKRKAKPAAGDKAKRKESDAGEAKRKKPR